MEAARCQSADVASVGAELRHGWSRSVKPASYGPRPVNPVRGRRGR